MGPQSQRALSHVRCSERSHQHHGTVRHTTPNLFEQLQINGAHAMQGKGSIRVAVGTRDSSCQIAFIDGGPGIPADIREKIFTPFFTTKSRGLGLGLPTAKRLIEAHNGQIAIDCPPAGGTKVVIHLPMGAA